MLSNNMIELQKEVERKATTNHWDCERAAAILDSHVLDEYELNEDIVEALLQVPFMDECSVCGRISDIYFYKKGSVCDKCLNYINKNC
jgi:hypothetical protein